MLYVVARYNIQQFNAIPGHVIRLTFPRARCSTAISGEAGHVQTTVDQRHL